MKSVGRSVATGLIMIQVSGSAPAAQVLISQDTIVILEPLRPTETVSSSESSCDDNRFAIKIKSSDSVGERLQSIKINGKELSDEAKRSILEMINESTFIMDAFIAECSGNYIRDVPTNRGYGWKGQAGASMIGR